MWNNFKQGIKYRLKKQHVEHPVLHSFLKWIMILLIIIFALLLLLFILVFIVFPLVFMNSVAVQRFLIFQNVNVPKNPNFNAPLDYGYEGVTNFYVTSTVDMYSKEILSVGAWWIPHEKYINSTESMDDILAKNEYPLVLYNHGVLATRILEYDYVYRTLRKFFHIVAIDYRDFGDSSPHDLTENGVVTDVIQTYNLMKTKTKADIYIWGHSLGGGISTHAAKWLKDNQSEIIAGLIIESSFTCLQDEVYEFALGKFFRWLPWFEWCVIDPIHNNGFIFNTTSNVQDVDCPVMIMHAEDDPVIPFFLGEENYQKTSASRRSDQGKVFFHFFSASKGYGHVGCTQDPQVPTYIKDFISECERWRKRYFIT